MNSWDDDMSNDSCNSASTPKIPKEIQLLTFLAVGSSFYVVVEPAPTDLVFIILGIFVVLKPGLPLIRNAGLFWLFGLTVCSILSLAGSAELVKSLVYVAVTIYLFAAWYIIVVLLRYYGFAYWQLLKRSYLIAALAAALIGFVSHFSTVFVGVMGMTPIYYGTRIQASFKDPNVYSPFLCSAFLVVLSSLLTGENSKRSQLLCFGMAGLFALEIIGAFSRAGYVNALIGIVVLLGLHIVVIRSAKRMPRILAITVSTLVIVVPVALLIIDSLGLSEYLMQRLQRQGYDDHRFSGQSLALQVISEKPLGVGPGQAANALGIGTHNVFLRIAIENGVMALICFVGFLLYVFWTAFRGTMRRSSPYRDVYAMSLAVLTGISVNSLVIDSLHWRFFFLFLAIPIGLSQRERLLKMQSRPA